MNARQVSILILAALLIIFGFVVYKIYKAAVTQVEIINQDREKKIREINGDTSFGEPIGSGVTIIQKGPEEVSCLPDRQARGRSIRMKVTAYCLCKICCGKWAAQKIRRTSTGDNAKIYDGVAADPKLLSYRIRLNIPGIGVKEVDDTGGGMRQSAKQGIYHIDVRMKSHETARKWGVQWLDVEVLGS